MNVHRLIAIALVAGALAALAAGAWAAPIEHDEALKQERMRLVVIYVRTASCMRQAASAMLRHGARNDTPILGFMRSTCGTPLHSFLTSQTGFTAREADTLIQHLAEQILASQVTPAFPI